MCKFHWLLLRAEDELAVVAADAASGGCLAGVALGGAAPPKFQLHITTQDSMRLNRNDGQRLVPCVSTPNASSIMQSYKKPE